VFGWLKRKPKEKIEWTVVKTWSPSYAGGQLKGFIVGEENRFGERRLTVIHKCTQRYNDKDYTFETIQGIEALQWQYQPKHERDK
jgi:hypothetical protein